MTLDKHSHLPVASAGCSQACQGGAFPMATDRETGPVQDGGISLDTLTILLRQALSGLVHDVDHRLASRSLTLAKSLPLMALRDGQRHTATSIARHGHCDAGAMTRTISDLEEKGFITRDRSLDDRRLVYLQLTSEGAEAANAVPPVLDAVMDARLAGLTDAERCTLMNLLRRICESAAAGEN